MNTITAFLARLGVAQPDKVLHFVVGLLLQLALRLLLPPMAALGAVSAIAWGKERYDKAHQNVHTPDGWDAYATMLGALVFELILELVIPPLFSG